MTLFIPSSVHNCSCYIGEFDTKSINPRTGMYNFRLRSKAFKLHASTDEFDTQNVEESNRVKLLEEIDENRNTYTESSSAVIDKDIKRVVQKTDATFAPKASTAMKNPAVPGSVLYAVFEVQAYASMLLGGALSGERNDLNMVINSAFMDLEGDRRMGDYANKDNTALVAVADHVNEDVMQMFFKDRELNGDLISKAVDLFWQSGVVKGVNADGIFTDAPKQVEQEVNDDNEGGFLRLSQTQEWLLGDNYEPINKKVLAKELKDERERRKKLNFLHYEALKREMMFLSVGIGTACSVYCLLLLSVQAAISYFIGVLFSCLYLQLLFQHVDNLSKDMVPQIFTQKKAKKIGIRSKDLESFLERSIKGSSVALSSPRIVIPAAIYGIWIFSRQYVGDLFEFQLVPAMLGMFVYKAAALVQVYRDNEDLKLIFPDND